ncbi:hypothetical protein BATDEDRAFT_92018 [Batrachochytrium dendrobatidis JAM81]|uniref:Uncharacterized protein n=2 Tax=Batrachochytrium dendrobatidis TaxID=109871 RepID=F4PC58_BATDJ|nr:uncharacterized protein BATDEDRAFT_92018 [Batrachochytrium dendrobatidis JAM81]EGF77164.1 hypothetical protein BATDEDRAFT_92018 [Batrachochytrium dendrobatidis JAM81]|eukprot:XP_006682297.1 hypothetical protein BATDEDRAFT_92018 [Batrachochytrium dendrobatidis JAM81]
MRLTDILLALTLVITSSMAVVPPGKNAQTPQSSQSPECQPGPSNECQPKTNSPKRKYIILRQIRIKYKDLKKKVKDAKENMNIWCSDYRKLKNELKSHQTSGRSGLGSGLAKLVPKSVKQKHGKAPDEVTDVELELLDRCLEAKGIYKEFLQMLKEFKETHGTGFTAKAAGVFRRFKK